MAIVMGNGGDSNWFFDRTSIELLMNSAGAVLTKFTEDIIIEIISQSLNMYSM